MKDYVELKREKKVVNDKEFYKYYILIETSDNKQIKQYLNIGYSDAELLNQLFD